MKIEPINLYSVKLFQIKRTGNIRMVDIHVDAKFETDATIIAVDELSKYTNTDIRIQVKRLLSGYKQVK